MRWTVVENFLRRAWRQFFLRWSASRNNLDATLVALLHCLLLLVVDSVDHLHQVAVVIFVPHVDCLVSLVQHLVLSIHHVSRRILRSKLLVDEESV